MRPPLVYFGGKTLLADRIAALMPTHGHYVEPFGGSLSVLLAKPPSPHETVNDLDQDLITFWRVLRDRPGDLARVCALTPHSRAEHTVSYEPASTDLERARRVWVQLTQGRAGIRTRTGWRHYQDPAGSTGSMPDYLSGYVDRMPAVVDRLLGVSLECRPATDVIADYGRHPGVLLYVDPPYLGSTRTSGGYLHDMANEPEHKEMLTALLGCRSAVMLSGYASDLYDDALSGWDRVEIPTATGQGGKWLGRTEVLWCNRPMPRQQTLFEDVS